MDITYLLVSGIDTYAISNSTKGSILLTASAMERLVLSETS